MKDYLKDLVDTPDDEYLKPKSKKRILDSETEENGSSFDSKFDEEFDDFGEKLDRNQRLNKSAITVTRGQYDSIC